MKFWASFPKSDFSRWKILQTMFFFFLPNTKFGFCFFKICFLPSKWDSKWTPISCFPSNGWKLLETDEKKKKENKNQPLYISLEMLFSLYKYEIWMKLLVFYYFSFFLFFFSLLLLFFLFLFLFLNPSTTFLSSTNCT